MSPHKPLSGWRVSRLAFAVLLVLACSRAAHANAWTNGQVITYTQSDWGAGGSAATLLSTNFISVYPSALVVVGERATGFTMAFDNAASISSYLPTSGSAGVLDSNTFDTSSTSSGTFGGDVLALQLNVDFSDAGVTLGSSGIAFGDLVLENHTPVPSSNGLTVRQILADANTDLGGGNSGYSLGELVDIIPSLDIAFDGGIPTVLAQDDLVAPGTTPPTPTPEPSSMLLLGTGVLAVGAYYRRRVGAL